MHMAADWTPNVFAQVMDLPINPRILRLSHPQSAFPLDLTTDHPPKIGTATGAQSPLYSARRWGFKINQTFDSPPAAR